MTSVGSKWKLEDVVINCGMYQQESYGKVVEPLRYMSVLLLVLGGQGPYLIYPCTSKECLGANIQ